MSEAHVAVTALSVVIVNWNTKELLLQVLADFLPSDRGREIEVLVVDNASADGSVEAARERFPVAEFPELRFLVQESNLGFAGGVNIGFAASRHPLILLLNTDVRTSASDIEALAAYVDQHAEVGIAGPLVRNEDGSLQDSYWRIPTRWRLFCSATFLYKLFARSQLCNGERYAGTRFTQPTAVDAVSGCVFLLRRELIERIGGLDQGYFMYFEETDLCHRAARAGYEVHYAPVGEFVHFLGGSSRLARRRNFLEFRRSLVRFHRKHGGVLAALAARALLFVSHAVRLPGWAGLGLLPGERGLRARTQAGLLFAGLVDVFRPAPPLEVREPEIKSRSSSESHQARRPQEQCTGAR